MAPIRRGRTGAQQTVGADHFINGIVALSPLMLIVLILISGIAFFFFSQLQITSTEQTVFDILQISTQLVPGMTANQLQQFMNGQLDHYQTIATAIGWAVQIALFMLSFPVDAALHSLHRRFNHDVSPALTASALNYSRWRSFLTRVLIGGDILTDFYYVAKGHNLITSTVLGVIPTSFGPDAFGVILIGIVYPIAVCFVTIFVGKYLLVFVEALIEKFPRGV